MCSQATSTQNRRVLSIRNFIVEIRVIAAKTERRTGKQRAKNGVARGQKAVQSAKASRWVGISRSENGVADPSVGRSGSNDAPSVRRNLLQRRKSKPKNGFPMSVEFTFSVGRLHAGRGLLIFPGRP